MVENVVRLYVLALTCVMNAVLQIIGTTPVHGARNKTERSTTIWVLVCGYEITRSSDPNNRVVFKWRPAAQTWQRQTAGAPEDGVCQETFSMVVLLRPVALVGQCHTSCHRRSIFGKSSITPMSDLCLYRIQCV